MRVADEIFKALWQVLKLNQRLFEMCQPLRHFALTKNPAHNSLFEQQADLDALNTLSPADKLLCLDSLILLAGLVHFPEDMLAQARIYCQAMGLSDAEFENCLHAQKSELARDDEADPAQWLERSLRAYLIYLQAGVTPFYGFYSQRLLHFLSNNRSSELQGLLARVFHPHQPRAIKSNWLDLTSTRPLVESVNSEGYAVFPSAIPLPLCQKIHSFALKTPAYPSMHDRDFVDHNTGKRTVEAVLPDFENPLSRRYDFDLQDVLHCPAIQEIIAQPIFIQIAEDYFQAKAVLNLAYLWWSTDFQGPHSRYDGQVWHIDIDRFKFLNFFIYLNDVGPDNGPHEYIRGSHKQKPLALAVDKRMSREELDSYYPADDFQMITGPMGTVFAADTKAFHRGHPLKKGRRLVLQLDFATDRFGENTPRLPVKSSRLKAIRQNYPYALLNYA